MQTAAVVACRQLGFGFLDGAFRGIESVPANVTLLPSWLGRLPCTRLVATVEDCGEFEFGDTGTCGLMQRLVCNDGAGQ